MSSWADVGSSVGGQSVNENTIYRNVRVSYI